MKLIPNAPNMSPKFLKNHNQINFVIAPVTNEEILDIIHSLANKSELIILPLAYIINMSFLTGVYPDLIKNS